jgi:protocatechuate 3,4-dioxygenase beta subunit
MLGPFYEPGAPVRTRVGSGYELSGRVLAAKACKPIPNARIEFWLANSRAVFKENGPLVETRRAPTLLYSLNAEGFLLGRVHPFLERL